MDIQLPIMKLDEKKPKLILISLNELPENSELDLPSGHPSRELVEDIYERGLDEPIHVSIQNGKWFIESGNKRTASYRILAEKFPEDPRFKKILALQRENTLEAAMFNSVANNNMRFGNPITDIKTIKYVLDNYPSTSDKALAQMLGMNLQTLKKRRRLLGLSDTHLHNLANGNISISVATELAKLPIKLQNEVKASKKGKISLDAIKDVQRIRVDDTISSTFSLPDFDIDDAFGYVVIKGKEIVSGILTYENAEAIARDEDSLVGKVIII